RPASRPPAKTSRSHSWLPSSRRSRPHTACVIFRESRVPHSQLAHIALAGTASARPCPPPAMSPHDLRQSFFAEARPSAETALPPADTARDSSSHSPSCTTAAPATPGLSLILYQFPLTLCPTPLAP